MNISTNNVFTSADRSIMTESVQRLRRIETRLTRQLEATGIDTGIHHPWWKDGAVIVPSPMTSLHATLNCIPRDHQGTVQVIHKDGDNYTVMCRVLR